jgi:hypothetical protein
VPSGICDRLVMRMFPFRSSHPRAVEFSERDSHRPQFKIRVFRVFGPCRANSACSPTDSYHPGAKPWHQTHQGPVRLVPEHLRLPTGTWKPPDPATTIVNQLREGVPRWRSSHEPSRVLWIGRLSRISLVWLGSRLGCVRTYNYSPVSYLDLIDC